MDKEGLIEFCNKLAKIGRYIQFPEDFFNSIDSESAKELAHYFSANTLIKLPIREIEFFEWLRRNDQKVWDDLWANSDEEPYLVSISFMPVLIDQSRGFPICDLLENDNYYFSDAHIIDKDARIFLDSVKERFLEKNKLSVAQTLAMEISLAPIDIWHFAFRYNLNLDVAKKAVRELVEDNILIHLTNTEHLANFVEI